MLNIVTRTILILIILSLLTTCDDYEFPKSPYPKIETLPVVNITEAGAMFQANINQLAELPVINHGFIWGKDENLDISSENKINMGPVSKQGKTQTEIKSDLIKGEQYFVRAFASTEKYQVYGNTVSFISNGSTPPLISSFEPSEGTWGDTIIIRGKFFSLTTKNNQVKFGSFDSNVLSSNDSVITCIVPKDIAEKTVPLYVSVAGNQAQSATNFKLITPIIENISPSNGTFDDIITITGNNFSPTIGQNVVKFNEHFAEVMQASKTSLKVKVPTSIRAKENIISVMVNRQTASSTLPFLILPPTIESLSSNKELIGAIIIINGNKINPTLSGNTVFLGNTKALINNATKTQITIEIPEDIYKSRSFNIEVRVAEQSAFSQEVFTLQNTWIRKADVPHGPYGRYDAVSFSIMEMGYVGLGSGGVGNKFWKYDPETNSWSEVAPFPGGERAGATSFVIGNKAYVGLGEGIRNDFWSYDPQTNSWMQLADFPYKTYMAKGFSVNGKGYVLTRTSSDNFWQYDPNSNQWTQLSDIPTDSDFNLFLPDAGFVINNRLFIYLVDASTAPNQLWEYDFSNMQWKRWSEEYDYSINMWTSGFSINDKGYIHGYYFLNKYDPTNDTWTTNLEGAPGMRALSIAFVIGNKAYIGCSYYNGLVDMWEFDPDFE